MRAIFLIAQNTIREMWTKRIFSFFLVALLLCGFDIMMSDRWLQIAFQRGGDDVLREGKRMFGSILSTWMMIGTLIAVWGGSTVVAAEIKSKTILTLLTRPVSRSQFVIGKWLGVHAVLGFYFVLGCALAFLLGGIFGLSYNAVLFMGLAKQFLSLSIAASSCFLFGMVMSALPAVIGVCVLSIANSLYTKMVLGKGMISPYYDVPFYYLYPAEMPYDLVRVSLTSFASKVDMGMCLQILAENGLYVLAIVLISAVIFESP